jgi:hypothetical protein
MKAKPAPIVGSMWRNHVTREIWVVVVVSVDVTPGYVELRREGRRDIATPLADFHLDWSEVE